MVNYNVTKLNLQENERGFSEDSENQSSLFSILRSDSTHKEVSVNTPTRRGRPGIKTGKFSVSTRGLPRRKRRCLSSIAKSLQELNLVYFNGYEPVKTGCFTVKVYQVG